jgi:hypothetical protein
MPTINVYVSDKTYHELGMFGELNPPISVSLVAARLTKHFAELNDRQKGPRNWYAVVLAEKV